MKVSFADLALLGMTTIYIPILPIGVETQPTLIVVMLFFIYPLIFKNLNKKRNKEMLGIKVLLLFLIVRTLWDVHFYHDAPITLVKYVVPLLFYVGARHLDLRPSARLFDWLIGIHCVLALLYLSGHASILQPLFHRYSVGKGGIRGFSFLSEEPSYAATYLFALFISIYVSDIPRKKYYLWITLGFIALTKSLLGMGFILLGVFLVLESALQALLIGGAVAALGAAVVILASNSASRIDQFIHGLQRVNGSDVLLSLAFFEPSGMVRILTNGYSFFMGFRSLVGYGIGSFSSTFITNAHTHGASVFLYDEALSTVYRNYAGINPQSGFASLAYEMGVFSLLYLIPYGYCVRRTWGSSKIWMISLAFALITLLFQSQISDPIPLYVLLLLANCAESRAAPPRGEDALELMRET